MKKKALSSTVLTVLLLGIFVKCLGMRSLPKTEILKEVTSRHNRGKRQKLHHMAVILLLPLIREFIIEKTSKLSFDELPQLLKMIFRIFPNLKNYKEAIWKLFELYMKFDTYDHRLIPKNDRLEISKLSWGENVEPERRFYLILDLLNNVAKKNKDKTKTLDFVSFGSGGLLMEYLTIIALLEMGYKKINIYVIDPIYKSEIYKHESSPLGAFKKLLQGDAGVTVKDYTSGAAFLSDWKKGRSGDIIQMILPAGESKQEQEFEEIISNIASENSLIYRLYFTGDIVIGGDRTIEMEGSRLKIGEKLKPKGYKELEKEE